jgi:hypothetical protein
LETDENEFFNNADTTTTPTPTTSNTTSTTSTTSTTLASTTVTTSSTLSVTKEDLLNRISIYCSHPNLSFSISHSGGTIIHNFQGMKYLFFELKN